jgi:hypothetical protein
VIREQSLRMKAVDETKMAATMRGALERSKTAIDDWLHVYAAELCDEAGVCESQKRVAEYGTLSYIAGVQDMNVAALATDDLQMPRDLTDEQADAAMRATAVHLDIKGSQLTVNREKMKARYRALVKFIEAEQCRS